MWVFGMGLGGEGKGFLGNGEGVGFGIESGGIGEEVY